MSEACCLLSLRYLLRALVETLEKTYKHILDDDVTLFHLSPLFFTLPAHLLSLSAFFTSSHCISYTPFFTYLSFLSHLSSVSQHTVPKTTPYFFCYFVSFLSCHQSIHLSITTLSLFLSLSLIFLCCGLCLPSLSELLSLLSAPLVRTKSSCAHGTTKDKREIKGKSLN